MRKGLKIKKKEMKRKGTKKFPICSPQNKRKKKEKKEKRNHPI
jgi:hypothetical protein